jgi:16S rRNA (cytosine1402-N4)-methyltransferase
MEPTMPVFEHRPVLLDEALRALAIDGERCHATFIDGTFGRGGHSRAILSQLASDGRLLAFDRDPEAIAVARGISDARFAIVHASFAELAQQLATHPERAVAGVLLDLGVSSPQIDDAGRGFSFRNDGPLDMRMDPTRGESAAQWLARASQDEIRGVIRDYGEERFALQIAKTIVARRTEQPISRTRELATLVASAVRTREKGQDPATRTFQAIRIYINQELAELEQGLKQAMDALMPGGRLVVISFHSLEDRIVKRFMQALASPAQPPARLPLRAVDLPRPLARVAKKIMPGDAEVAANPRARSAVMRVAEKLADSGVRDAS